MFAQNSPIHKKSAAFALETYAGHLILTDEQKKDLIELITDKYRISSHKDIDKVTNILIDIIDGIEPEKFIIDSNTIKQMGKKHNVVEEEVCGSNQELSSKQQELMSFDDFDDIITDKTKDGCVEEVANQKTGNNEQGEEHGNI